MHFGEPLCWPPHQEGFCWGSILHREEPFSCHAVRFPDLHEWGGRRSGNLTNYHSHHWTEPIKMLTIRENWALSWILTHSKRLPMQIRAWGLTSWVWLAVHLFVLGRKWLWVTEIWAGIRNRSQIIISAPNKVTTWPWFNIRANSFNANTSSRIGMT